MNNQPLPFKIEPMQLSDVPAVMVIDRAAYPSPWSQKAYAYELRQNKLAHYSVVRTSLSHPPVRENQLATRPLSAVVGVGGFWLLADEAHISTIAVHPAWRRLGIGEWILLTLMDEGQALGASVATLEVRLSNQPAQALYRKYQFKEVGRRPGYYGDNGEDALILTTPPLALLDYQAMLHQRKAALWQRLAQLKVDKIGQIG